MPEYFDEDSGYDVYCTDAENDVLDYYDEEFERKATNNVLEIGHLDTDCEFKVIKFKKESQKILDDIRYFYNSKVLEYEKKTNELSERCKKLDFQIKNVSDQIDKFLEKIGRF